MFYKRFYYDDENTEIHELEVLNSFNYELQYNEDEELETIKIFVNGFRSHLIECENADDAKFNLKVVELFKKYLEYAISNDNKIIDLNLLFDKCTALAIAEDEEDEE